MWILMVEALVALSLLVFIVWWTMYAGRPQPGKTALEEQQSHTAIETAAASPPEWQENRQHDQSGSPGAQHGAHHQGHGHHHPTGQEGTHPPHGHGGASPYDNGANNNSPPAASDY